MEHTISGANERTWVISKFRCGSPALPLHTNSAAGSMCLHHYLNTLHKNKLYSAVQYDNSDY